MTSPGIHCGACHTPEVANRCRFAHHYGSPFVMCCKCSDLGLGMDAEALESPNLGQLVADMADMRVLAEGEEGWFS